MNISNLDNHRAFFSVTQQYDCAFQMKRSNIILCYLRVGKAQSCDRKHDLGCRDDDVLWHLHQSADGGAGSILEHGYVELSDEKNQLSTSSIFCSLKKKNHWSLDRCFGKP